MDSDSATSPSSPPPLPPAVPHELSYPDSEETPEPEDYETASEPGVNDSDSPEKTSLKSSPETGNLSASTEDEGGFRGSTLRGDLSENSDSAGNSNGVGLGFGEMDDAVDTDDGVEAAGEKAVNGGTGETRELEAKELDEALVMQPKVREFGVSDSAPNEKAAEEVEPKVVESESSVAVAGEVEGDAHKEFSASVGDNEKFVNLDEVLPADGDVLPADGDVLPADGDVLEDNHGAVEPEDVEVKNFESLAVDAADVKTLDTGHQLELVVEDEKQPENPVKAGVVDEVVSKASVGEDNLLKGDAPEFDSIDSNDENARENLVESSEIVKSEPSKSSADDLDQGHCSEISDRSPVVGETAADDGDLNSTEEAKTPSDIPKESVVNSADDFDQGKYGEISDRSPIDGEITADDGDLNSAEEAKTPDITKESVVGDENARGTTTGMAHEKIEDDKPDEVNLSDASEGITPLSEGIAIEKAEVGSEHVSGHLHGENEVEVEALPVVTKETVVEDDNTGGIDVLDDTPNQELSEVVCSEHVSGHVEDEAEFKLTADDGDLKSAEEGETLPVVPKEAIVGNENIEEAINGSTDALLNQESGENKLVPSLENESGVRDEEPALELTADGGDLNTAEEVKNVPVVPEETVVGDENIEETVNRSTDKLDGASLNQEVGDGKLVSGSENTSGDGDSEPVLELTEHDGNLNTTEEVNTVPVIPVETVVGDEKIEQSTNVSLPLNSDTDKLVSTSLDREIGEGELVIGSNHASHGEDKPAEETLVGDEVLPQVPELGKMVEPDAGESQISVADEENDGDEEEDGRASDGPAGAAILNSSEAAQQYIRELERISSSSQSGLHVDGQIVTDSDDAGDSDEDGEGGEMFDSTALAALLRAATSSSDGTVTVTAQDAARIFSVDRPVGLGASAPSLRPAASRFTRPGLFTPSEIATVEEPDSSMDDDERRLHEKVEEIRVKFLRLVYKLGHSPDDAVAGQVLYRLSLAEGIKRGRQTNRAFSIETAKRRALQLEAEGKDDLNFSCNIMVIGKTGVGKSATINSIFGEERSQTNPFQLTTTSVREVCGVVDGVRVRVLDTPGLKPSIMDQAANRKILSSIKKSTKKCPPDIVLYVDRMDTQTRDFNDLPLLKSITSVLGSSIWFNAIVALTHAASAPPDGPNGSPLGYDVFVSQRSHVVQQSIRQAAGDMRLMNPVALVENHPSCRRNREGERVLPNGLSWRPQLLLLSYASKILSEANSLLKLQDPSPGKLFGGFRLRSPPLPFLLSSLLQARPHPKLSGDQGGDNADSDVDLDEFSDAEQDEEVDEYDQLPPFKPLRKSQIAMLTKEQKRAYLDEYDYRVKLLQKKQWKEELRRLKEAKKKGKGGPAEFPNGDMPDDYDQENGPAAVQVPLPDMVLPPSFDCDNPAFRYRFLEPTSQLLTRPVLDTHGWDHDCGYDGVNIEENLAIAGRFPTSMAVQITKDKKEFNIHLDSSVAAKHGEHGSTVAGFDIQSVGKQLAYILRGETKFDSVKKNKTAAGVSVTFLGETVATGLKVEDRISISKRLGLVASTGAVRAQGDVAYGANLEVRVRDKDYPIGQALSTLGLSLMKWRSDLALGANLQSQFSVGRNSKMAVRVGLNNKLTGQITVRTSTSDQFQIALAGIIPLAVHIFRTIKSNESFMDH